MRKKVLITGASGFVGYHLVTAAVNAGMNVHAAVRPSSKVEQLQQFKLQYVTPEYNDHNSLTKLLEQNQYNYIIHAAGATRAGSAEEYNTINAENTRNLVRGAISASIPLEKFVFISSLAALGPVEYNDEWPVPDGVSANPVTRYGASKLLAEKYLEEFITFPWVTLRPTAVYGPYEKDLFVLFKTFKKGMEFYMGRNPQKLSFIYVKDLAEAAILALTTPPIHTGYNISDGECYDRYALANIFKQLLGVHMLRLHIPIPVVKLIATVSEMISKGTPLLNNEKLRELTARNWNCSIAQARFDLGFNPQYNLGKGMEETLTWYKEHKWF
jgi:UDP-glucose 4-epimerase